ncbi:BppU family phage baseplate upper protein [Paenibacillus planticolens]|uniref:DUF2479 domain-containing protein n=1 Tax=Paenibacillus planticolens TaxID=2654976 RepID=A0ABX1ZMM1_9BACL|nr:BppU family phage baseplate upper protein [Paenibacillus planticolens]NOV01334.1 DUF2479 domain-containing protein [Paenibacillus planticolens]
MHNIEIESIRNMVDASLAKVETLAYFVAPVQSVVEKKELESSRPLRVLNMKRHDTRTAIKAQLKTPKGNPVNLTDCEVKFTMAKARGNRVLIKREAIVLNESDGLVCFAFEPEEADVLGPMRAEFKVTYADGSTETFPNQGYLNLNFEADLA